MSEGFYLEKHSAITSTNIINKIVKPLNDIISIKHFRYLKIYNNGERILLSNHSDCMRFIYGSEVYKKMWYDGEFPKHMTEGWHAWDVLRNIEESGMVTPLEQDINTLLGLYHGITYISAGNNFYEVYTFDTDTPIIYYIDKAIFLRFIAHFKDTAYKLIQACEHEKLVIPLSQPLFVSAYNLDEATIDTFLRKTPINRYYLKGNYSHIYLTKKEIKCIYWLSQGKSIEETALIEGNSIKTIIRHIENMKDKLGCNKQTQLVCIVMESGVLNCIVQA